MAWIKSFAIGLIIFSMFFIAYFQLFQTMDSGYGYASGFNYSDTSLFSVNNTTHYEITSSYQSTNSTTQSFQNTSLTSLSAYDSLIGAGYNALTTVWNAPTQVFHLITTTIGGLLGIDYTTYKWLYDGLFTIIMLLVLFAILNIIFRSNI